MGKHKAPKMTKAQKKIYDDYHADPSKTKLIRRPSDIIAVIVLSPMILSIGAANAAMAGASTLSKIGSIFRGR